MKSIGLALLIALPTANESTGAPASLKTPMRSTSIPPETTIFTCWWPGQVEAGADLLHELGRDAAALRGRVETDAPQAVTERLGHAQRLLRLVLERVDEDDRGTSGSMWRSKASAARTVSPKMRTRACGIVPVGARPARRAPAGVDAPMQPPTTDA